MCVGQCVCACVLVFPLFSLRTGGERWGAAAKPNDGHYSPLSDAGARSMKLRHFSPEERGGAEEEWEGGDKETSRCRGGGDHGGAQEDERMEGGRRKQPLVSECQARNIVETQQGKSTSCPAPIRLASAIKCVRDVETGRRT